MFVISQHAAAVIYFYFGYHGVKFRGLAKG